MADLIDRQELISWMSKDPLFPQVEAFGLTSVIESRPSVDAVPVVRCKDCKFHEDEEPGMVWCSHIVSSWMGEEDYCSLGERRKDETDDTPTEQGNITTERLNTPTIDAVPVVRCKDCKHRIPNPHGYTCKKIFKEVSLDDYCAWGERREDGCTD